MARLASCNIASGGMRRSSEVTWSLDPANPTSGDWRGLQKQSGTATDPNVPANGEPLMVRVDAFRADTSTPASATQQPIDWNADGTIEGGPAGPGCQLQR